MKLQTATFIFYTFISSFLFGQQCNNLGFDSGDFSNWDAWTGQATGMNSSTIPVMNNQGFNASQHVITTAGTDYWSGISTLAPNGGTYSAQLGNDQAGGGAEQLRQTFLVTPNLTSYVYQYAVVFEDPGHIGRPLFEVKIYDQNDSVIPCGEYLVRADQGLPGFISQTIQSTFGVYYIVYKDWTSVAMDLTSYLGDSITIEFTTADCNAGAHFGYAYIDGYCQTLQIDAVSQNCTNTYNLAAPSGFQNYVWSNGMTGQTITVPNAIAGDSISVVMSSLMGNCTTSLSYTFGNFSTPTAEFSSIDTCAGFNTYFIDSSYANIISWDWDFGDNTNSQTQNPNHIYTTGGGYDVTLTVTDLNGCTDTIIHPVIICTGGIADFSFQGLCYFDANFIDESIIPIGDSVVGWMWGFGDNTTSTLQNPSHTYPSDGTYSVTFTVYLNSGQTMTVSQTATLVPTPQADFNNTVPCFGVATQFTDLSQNNIQGWNWDFGDNTTSTLQNPLHNYQSASEYQVSLVVTDINNCVDTAHQQANVNPIPEIDILEAQEGCSPLNVNFSSVDEGSISSWNWNLGNGETSGYTNPSSTYIEEGSYDVTLSVIDTNGCTNQVGYQNFITVHPDPVADFYFTPEEIDDLNPQVQFFDISSNDVVSWSWEFGNAYTSTIQNPKHTYSAADTYEVTLYVENIFGCSDEVAYSLTVKPDFGIYIPNTFTPDGDKFNNVFSIMSYGLESLELHIFDRWGELIFTSNDINGGWDGTYKGSPIQDGTYVWKVNAIAKNGEKLKKVGHVSVIR